MIACLCKALLKIAEGWFDAVIAIEPRKVYAVNGFKCLRKCLVKIADYNTAVVAVMFVQCLAGFFGT